MKIFDFRMRPPYRSFLQCDFFNYTRSPFDWHSAPPASFHEKSFDRLKSEAAAAGVVQAAVWGRAVADPAKSSVNDDVAGVLREHGDLFVTGFGGICPQAGKVRESIAETQRCMTKLGLKGMTLEPSVGMRPLTWADASFLYPVYECLEGLGGILALTVSRGAPHDQTLAHSNPEAVDRVARDFPKLKIVISHAFWPWVQQSCGLAFRRPYVYLLPDLYGMAMPGHLEWVEAANTHLQDRMLFGSAYPYLGVEEMVASYLKLPYRAEVMEKVMFGNAQRLLGLA
jgi:predicted TIM-barrel fold metal-dependent hydrolase